MKRIAVVGAGLAGLAVSWYCLQDETAQVTLFDAQGIGAGASGASTGLLHLYVGKEAKLSWKAEAAYQESLCLLQEAEKASSVPVCQRSGLLRLAITEEQKKDFLAATEREETQLAWWKEEQVQAFLPEAAAVCAIWDASALTVFSNIYLQSLFQTCQKQGLLFEQREISSSQELGSYDAVIFALGANAFSFLETKHLPLMQTKGQALLCRSSHPLPCALLSHGHITPTPDPSLYQVGSTYERVFSSWDPDPEKEKELLEKAARFYPPAAQFQVVQRGCGVRVSPRVGYLPFAEQIGPKQWVFTGLGSRGLLYHAYLGKQLAEKVKEAIR